MRIRRLFVTGYYKLIYGNRFKYGANFSFRGSMKIMIEGNGSVVIGDNCFINNCFSATSLESIKIGNNCIFGESVKIYDHNHEHMNNGVPYRNQGFKSQEVTIGNNCWIASNVTILAGVHIGDNCIIGANCLVYQDIPADSLVKHKEDLIITNGKGINVS